MPDEVHFLLAVDAHPDDRATRLVYADWLDEQGDPRAELIRVEEEMRAAPASSDRYWELKPRRNALRQGCNAAWLERLRYGTDYEPTFADFPAGPFRSGWRSMACRCSRGRTWSRGCWATVSAWRSGSPCRARACPPSSGSSPKAAGPSRGWSPR